MSSPIIQHGLESRPLPEPSRVSCTQRSSVSRGLADFPSTIEIKSVQEGNCLQLFCTFFQGIYGCLRFCFDTLKKVLCGCFLSSAPEEHHYANEVSKGLTRFNNSQAGGQINGIYITTNETNLEATQEFFRNHPRPASEIKTIHIGCATWHNLDMICARKSTYGLIVDFNPKNAAFIRKTCEFINSSPSREVFKAKMKNHLNSLTGNERDLFFHRDQNGLPTDRIDEELMRNGSWLQSEESYRYLKEEVISKDRLVSITEDMRNFENFSRIREFLDEHALVVDTLYLSNICNFMNTDHDKRAFARSIGLLLNGESILINCPKIRNPDTGNVVILNQKAGLGREIVEDSCALLFEEENSTL